MDEVHDLVSKCVTCDDSLHFELLLEHDDIISGTGRRACAPPPTPLTFRVASEGTGVQESRILAGFAVHEPGSG